MELDPAVGPKERRADRPAEVGVEGRDLVSVGRLADEAGAGDAAAADDAVALDAVDDRAAMGGQDGRARKDQRPCESDETKSIGARSFSTKRGRWPEEADGCGGQGWVV